MDRLDAFVQTAASYFPCTYHSTVRSLVQGTVLDLGCGKAWTWRFCRLTPRSKDSLTVGADISQPYLEYCQAKECYQDLIRCDASNLPFKDASFDAVLLLQLIEHFRKEEGLRLIKEAERIARKQVILGTPVGFLGFDFHLSGWLPEELETLGYTVTGHGIRLPRPENRARGIMVQLSRVSCLFPFTYRLPGAAYQMLAFKRMRNE